MVFEGNGSGFLILEVFWSILGVFWSVLGVFGSVFVGSFGTVTCWGGMLAGRVAGTGIRRRGVVARGWVLVVAHG